MEVHTLEIDSSERDYSKYPDPHDYVIDLKNEIYDIQKITLLSARIPNSQTLINAHNNTFSVNNFQENVADSLTLDGSGITTPSTLVSTLANSFSGMDVVVELNKGALLLKNDSLTLTKNIDFTGTVSSNIGIPSELIQIVPGANYRGQSVIFGSITSMSFDIEYTNIQRSVTFPGGTFKTGGDLAVAFSLSTGLHTMYIENRLRVFNTSLFDITLKLTGTTASQIGLNEGDISIMKSTYHQGATSLFGIIPDLAFELRNVETSIINLYNRSFTNGDDLASNISDHITQVTVSFDSDTNALTWLNNDPQ